MKVLWLTNTPVGASDYLKVEKATGGWMSSLESHIKKREGLDLGVCFFFENSTSFKFDHQGVRYYPVQPKGNLFLNKIRSKLFSTLVDTNKEAVLRVIDDFQPDVIQLFGTESGLGEALINIKIPYIIHIQGLVNPCLAAWFPNNITQRKLIAYSPLHHILLKKGILGDYYLFKKWAKREETLLKNAKYFFGRTEWDKKTIRLYSDGFKYFHCNELLRQPFFESNWELKTSDTISIITTINPNIYKGLDVLLKTANLLNKKSGIKFKWTVIGLEESNALVHLVERMEKTRFKSNHVSFTGYLSVQKMIDKLLSSDLFVHPSHIDNSPNSVCEAMLLGMPVIAGNVGGVPSIIENNINGILYNSHDPFDLAGKILDISTDSGTLGNLSRRAKETALERHNASKIVDTVVNTYKKIISEKGNSN